MPVTEMLRNIRKNRILLSLLLVCFLLTGGLGVANAADIMAAEADVWAGSSAGGSDSGLAVKGAVNTGPLDYLTANNAGALPNLSLRQSRGLLAKADSDFLSAAAAAQALCFLSSSRLCNQISSQVNSIKITFYLYKKD